MKKGGLRHTTRVPHFSRSLREVGISVTTRAFTFSPANTAHVTFGARIGQSSLPFLRPLSNNTSQSHWVALRRLGGGPAAQYAAELRSPRAAVPTYTHGSSNRTIRPDPAPAGH